MDGFMWFILFTAVCIVLIVGWIVVSELKGRGGREAPSTRTPTRSIRATYGAGYGLLGWDEEFAMEVE